jgi:alkanesulfonate monooxygenase SsuD/methylene tetrahydromethanopterin reductase-like flavin-dependent oxidoreductase (luciferase family)
MRFALMTEPQQGLSYVELLAIARTAEEAGFEAFFRSDHYTSFPGEAHARTTDAWTTLGGLARETERINLGVLVSPVTFRIPGAFAKVVMTADEMSGGRGEVGGGAGWNALEHAEHGIPYPDTVERVDMLEEELRILSGFWREPDGWSFDGEHWQVREAYLRPRDRSAYAPSASPSRPNLIVGGSGKPRNVRLAAEHADEYNVSQEPPEACREAFGRLADACRKAGRDPGTMTRSIMTGTIVGRNESELRDRLADLMAAVGRGADDAEAWVAERRDRYIIGTPDQVRRRVREFEEAGAQRVMLQDFIPRDLEHVNVMAEVFLG